MQSYKRKPFFALIIFNSWLSTGCHKNCLHQKLRDKLPRSNDYETFVFGIVDELVWVFVSICKFEESSTEEKFGGKGFKIGLMR